MAAPALTVIGLDRDAFVAPRPRHRRERSAVAGTAEPCGDASCTVDVLGCTGCGDLACPSCGRSGANLDAGRLDSSRYADLVVACVCGCRFQPYAYGPEG
jgi:hypothetical protein